MSLIIPFLIGQLVTTPTNKLIEFKVSAAYQPKTKIVWEKNDVDFPDDKWYNIFNKDKLVLDGGVSINLPLGISFSLEDQSEKQKGTIINKTEGLLDMQISYESSKNIILITGKKSLTNSDFKSSLGLGLRLENETEKKDLSPEIRSTQEYQRKNSQIIALGEINYNKLPVKLFLKVDYATKLNGSELFVDKSLITEEENMKEELSQKSGSNLELTLGGKLPVGKTNFGLDYTLQSDKREMVGTFTMNPPGMYEFAGNYQTNKQLIQFFTEFAFGLVLKAGYSMEDFTKKGGIVEIKTVEGGSGLTVGLEYQVGFGKTK